jgi:hypothetical protein
MVTAEEARHYCHNLFKGDAKRFNDTSTEISRATVPHEVVQITKGRFISSAQQVSISTQLDSLEISTIMAKDKLSAQNSLSKTCEGDMKSEMRHLSRVGYDVTRTSTGSTVRI